MKIIAFVMRFMFFSFCAPAQGDSIKVEHIYYPNGNVKKIFHYYIESRPGITIQINPITLEEIKIRNLKSRILEGVSIDYYESGKVKISEGYHQGHLVGQSKEYYENGNLKCVKEYVNGKKFGKYYEYYENGNLEVSAMFDADDTIGNFTTFYEKGKMKVKGQYSAEPLNDTLWRQKPNSPDTKEIVYVTRRSSKIGTWFYYNENGDLERKEEY